MMITVTEMMRTAMTMIEMPLLVVVIMIIMKQREGHVLWEYC
jgi:hypothetical protein